MFLLVTSRQDFRQHWLAVFAGSQSIAPCCSGLAEALSITANTPMRLVVVDMAGQPLSLTPPDESLLALLRQSRVLLAGDEFAIDTELSALASGIAGCCSPRLTPAELGTVVDVVLKGSIWVSAAALPILLSRLQAQTQPQAAAGDGSEQGVEAFDHRWSRLTRREREIATQVAHGANNKMIARQLAVSDATIKAHLTSVFNKLQVSGRLQLALLLSAR